MWKAELGMRKRIRFRNVGKKGRSEPERGRWGKGERGRRGIRRITIFLFN
jgi:hypothetical protein